MKTIWLFVFGFLSLAFSFKLTAVYAQVDSLGVAVPIQIEGVTQAGDIICSEEGGFTLCDEPYQPSMYGVIVETPPAALESPDFDGPLALSSGEALVRVSTVNGPIAAGDIITTSENPGVGARATVNGFALGVAMESFESASAEDIGQILVTINIHPTSSFVGSRSNLVSNIRQALSSPVVAPLDSFRYLLAFIVALI